MSKSKVIKWLLRGLVAYVGVLVIWAAFAFWGGQTKLWRWMQQPQTYAFWQGGELYSAPPLFGRLDDTRGRLSETAPAVVNDVDIWVLLFEGADDFTNFPFREEFGLSAAYLRDAELGKSVILETVGLKFRVHPLPFFVRRSLVIVESAEYLRSNYRADCLGNLIYSLMIEERDQQEWDRCRSEQ